MEEVVFEIDFTNIRNIILYASMIQSKDDMNQLVNKWKQLGLKDFKEGILKVPLFFDDLDTVVNTLKEKLIQWH